MTQNVAHGPDADRPWCPTIELRSVGPGTFEARTVGGTYSAVGGSRKEAIAAVRAKLPPHEEPVIMNIPLPVPDYSLI